MLYVPFREVTPISAGAVASVVTRAKAIGLTWEAVEALSDDALERTLYGPKLALTVARSALVI